ncbi:hypothetical protein [Arthrobacter sp. NPDC092385]|uniref:hypothetical protein n=1 Tax=Arthrobacter sp. NPDC092385 TaxID=3363943 RepID=UPI0037F76787
MKIEITRSGGFAGLTRTWTLEVSRTEAEQRWLPLAEAEAGSTGSGAPPGVASPGGVSSGGVSSGGGSSEAPAPGAQRDRFTYRIAIGYTEVHVPESRLEDPWRELIERARAAPPMPGAPPAPGSREGRGAPAPDGPGGTDAGHTDTDPGKPQELL